MARVLVVGAGLSGLSVAMEASVRGHHVVVLEKRPSIGGRASSESRDGFPIGYGPHFLLKKGPLHQLVRKVSKVKPSVLPLRPHRLEILGQGMMQPRKPMMDAAFTEERPRPTILNTHRFRPVNTLLLGGSKTRGEAEHCSTANFWS